MVRQFPLWHDSPDSHAERATSKSSDPHVRAMTLGERMLGHVNALFCALQGHDNLLHFSESRMFLKCASCGRETPGWELDGTPPVATPAIEQRHERVAHPTFVTDRRIA
jgi:hypothetical protein